MGNPSQQARIDSKAKWFIAGGIALVSGYAAKVYFDRQFESEVSLLSKILDLRTGMDIGDVGAGKGKMTIAVASRIGSEGHLYATEIDPKRIEHIRRAVNKAGLANVTVLQATAESSGLPDNCCDAIAMRGVYHHLTRPVNFGESLWRALRPGGQLVIIDFPPKLLLWLCRPKDVPSIRGGHGIPCKVLIEELTSYHFVVDRITHRWPGRKYCVLFRKPETVDA